MDIEKGNIYNLLNGQCQYIIPVYQRKYSWLAEVHCARLWNDIVKMEKGHKKHHFVGSIVSIAEKKALMGVRKQLIIDRAYSCCVTENFDSMALERVKEGRQYSIADLKNDYNTPKDLMNTSGKIDRNLSNRLMKSV